MASRRLVEFGDVRFDPATGELFRAGERFALAPKPAAVLALLVERAGGLVTREEFYERAWPHPVHGRDLALNAAVREVRRALGDRAAHATYVETLPRRGYRLVAPVRPVPPVRPAPPSRPAAARRSLRAGIGRGAAVSGLVATAALALAVLLPRDDGGPAATIAVAPIATLGEIDGETVRLLEERLRNAAVERAGGAYAVIDDPAVAPERPPTVLVRATLHTATPDSSLLTVHVVRSADSRILWSGRFNPRCTKVRDPVGKIAGYVARVLAERVG